MKRDVTSKVNHGKAIVHYNEKRDKYRVRFNSVHPDQHDIVLTAISKARQDSGTDYDIVALTNICQQYLSCN